ncbi:hypothetical protein Q9Q94_05785 [Uliginosibacterium sp. 31-16]|uniref:hypothetical protein n=1 Tax=Uliginosibacterium sp. 31-16 TaxID=3068315 RepID=UPI00273F26FE|nr:hypothetical protein [Uliginosibacterium sp. 31-16]MDP5239031.1 hypothetical protein [Uliginosibacterium sp. 31-16]
MPNLHRSARAPTPPSRFQPMPLVSVFLSLIGRRNRKPRAMPNPDWEQDEPMTGLS